MPDAYWDGRTSNEWQDDNWHLEDETPIVGGHAGDGTYNRAMFVGTHTTYCTTFNADPSYLNLPGGLKIDAAYSAGSGGSTASLIGDNPIGMDGVLELENATLSDGALNAVFSEAHLRGSAGINFTGPASASAVYLYSGTHQVINSYPMVDPLELHLMNFDAVATPIYSMAGWNVYIHYSAQDDVQPDVSQVLEGVVFGVTGHTKTGTLVVIGSGGTGSRLGYECKLYRNAGTYDDEDWQEITPVRDVTLNLEKGEVDATTRANGGWKASLGALKEGSVEFDVVWDVSDEGFQALLDSYVNDTPVELAVMDGLIVSPGAQGLRATMTVLKFTRVEGLEEAVVANVTVKPTLADHAPEWLVVPE